MRREVNFDNGITKIVRKSKREDREMTWQEVANLSPIIESTTFSIAVAI